MPEHGIIRGFKAFVDAQRMTPLERLLAGRFQTRRARFAAAKRDAPLLCVNALHDPTYYAILGEIISALRLRHGLQVEQIVTQSLRPGASQTLRRFLRARMDTNCFSRRKWKALYDTFCDSIGYVATDWVAPWTGLRLWLVSWRRWRSLTSKDQLAAMTYGGISIGDLVIDSYLRMRPTVDVQLRDRYLLVVLRQALKEVELAQAYFRARRPALFFSFYSTYIQHGIPVRVATTNGVKTLTFGNLQEFCKIMTPGDLTHTRNTLAYSRDFTALPGRADRLRMASDALAWRLNGGIDPATAYMKKSAYVVTSDAVPDVRGAAVIFLHDFYDSVHIYSWILFHDFWEWVCFTIDTLEAAGRDFWIKPHPNQGMESDAEIARLRRKFPQAKFLSPDITNRQLVDAGMACAITVYGSVAIEMAFLGVPSIGSGDSPHASFAAFCVARTREAYARLLAQPSLPTSAERLREDAAACYHMHNQGLEGDAIVLRERFVDIYTHFASVERSGEFNQDAVETHLSAMTQSAAFDRFADTLIPTTHS